MSRSRFLPLILSSLMIAASVRALDIGLPTANDALLKPGHDADFFQPTVDGGVESGMFGCVRNNGHRFHEGIDIKCLQRDRLGEPTDPVQAVADGEIAFINARPGLSNYGRYIVVQHRWDGVQVFTLYAHLSAVAPGLVAGQPVKKAQVIGTLGHSANTRERITRDRAHLHFEVNFLLNPNFYVWYPKHDPKAPPFGNFNGQNLIGLDPAAFLRAYAANPKLNFAAYVAAAALAHTPSRAGPADQRDSRGLRDWTNRMGTSHRRVAAPGNRDHRTTTAHTPARVARASPGERGGTRPGILSGIGGAQPAPERLGSERPGPGVFRDADLHAVANATDRAGLVRDARRQFVERQQRVGHRLVELQ